MSKTPRRRTVAIIGRTDQAIEEYAKSSPQIRPDDIITPITPNTFGEAGDGKFDVAFVIPTSRDPEIIDQIVDYLYSRGTAVGKAATA